MKVSSTMFKQEDITSISIVEVEPFVPEDYLKQFLKDNPHIISHSIIAQKDNYYKILLRLDKQPPTRSNTLSLLITWCE